MSGVSMCRVVWVGDREGALWLPAGGIRASQGTFSSLKLYMCYGHGLKICMWFGYNSWIIFCHFFHNLNLVFFSGILVNG